MNVRSISSKITIKPTNKKMEKAKKAIDNIASLPKEEPLEKKVYIQSLSESFERIKDCIQISIENMKGCK